MLLQDKIQREMMGNPQESLTEEHQSLSDLQSKIQELEKQLIEGEQYKAQLEENYGKLMNENYVLNIKYENLEKIFVNHQIF